MGGSDGIYIETENKVESADNSMIIAKNRLQHYM